MRSHGNRMRLSQESHETLLDILHRVGRAQRDGAEAGCRALEDGSGKEGEPKASGAERAGNIDHTAVAVNQSKARCTILDPL